MTVNLIKGEELVEEEAICTSQEDINPENGKQIPINFGCKVVNVENATEYSGLEVVSSDAISNIPDNKQLINPFIVDQLIEIGRIKNYTSEEFKNEEIPVFSPTSIDTTSSASKGVFSIKGKFIFGFRNTLKLNFGITLLTKQRARCKISNVKDNEDEITVDCTMQEKLEGTKLMIGQGSAVEGYNEIIRLNKISTKEEVNIIDGKEAKLNEMLDVNLSFGQVNTLEIQETIISYVFIGLTTETINKNDNISMSVNLVKKEQIIKDEAICTSQEDIQPIDEKPVPIEFKCKVENLENATEFSGLEIVESEKISGLPTEPELLNPGKVDQLIESGDLVNYSLEENKKKLSSTPVFNITSINNTNSLKTGMMIINGEILSDLNLENKFEFPLTLGSGQKAECTLPSIKGKGETQLECILQEELLDTKVIIQQTNVLEGYNEIMKINKFSSNEKVTVSNGREIKLEKSLDVNLSFRQTSNFTFDSSNKSVKYDIAAFTSKTIKKETEIKVEVNLLKGIDSQKKDSICKSIKDIDSSEIQVPVLLNCEVNNLEIEDGEELTGIEILKSEEITNIPEDPVFNNPKKIDTLIASGEIEQATEEKTIPEFNATSINTTGSISSGTFSIEGTPLNDIEVDGEFDIQLLTGEKSTCTLSKSEKDSNAKIDCTLDGTIEEDKIRIPQTTVKKGHKELFNINKISSKNKVSCSNGKLKKANKKFENKISYRQMNHFNTSENSVFYDFSAFSSENLEKGKQIEMNVNLEKKNKELLSRKANCILNEDITGANGENQIAADFNCSIDNVENADQVVGLELISSEDISGIPNILKETNPSENDKLIDLGELLDFSIEENKNNIPPIFKISSFSSISCKSSGVFSLIGKFNKKITQHFKFNLPLSYPQIETRCSVPESNEGEEVEIICKTKSSFSNLRMIVEQLTISKNNSEIVSFLPLSSAEEISCEDYFSVSLKRMKKKLKAPFSFRQIQSFNNNEGNISFSLFGFKTDNYAEEKSLEIKASLIKNNLRHLEESSPTYIDCSTSSTNTNLVELQCNTNGDNDVDGVVILDSDNLSGIPSDTKYTNPAIVDLMIKNGTEKDCSNVDCSLSTFSNAKFTTCDNNGTIYINGDISGKIIDGSIFNLSIYPDSYGDCNISITSKKIECYNKEEIDRSRILIEEAMVINKDNNNSFLLKGGAFSEDDDLSCSINQVYHKLNDTPGKGVEDSPSSSPNREPEITTPPSTPSNSTEPYKNLIRKRGDSNGLSGGAIVAIILASIFAIVIVVVLVILFNQGKFIKKPEQKVENSSEIQQTTFAQLKIPQ